MRATAAAVLVLAAGCSLPKHDRTFGPLRGLMERPERIEALRIKADDPTRTDYLAWPEISKPVVPDSGTARELTAALLDAGNFGSPGKGCMPVPGVKLRYAAGPDTAEILLCFRCLTLFTYRNGNPVGQDDFDPGRARFVALVKRLFPKDPVIQGLE